MAANGLLQVIRRELLAVADPSRAEGAQRYMKSKMPFHGVAARDLRLVCRKVFSDLAFASPADFRHEILEIWRGATHREERYAAIELAGFRKFMPLENPDSLPVYEEMIINGAWWDYVDAIASHRLGALLRAFGQEMRPKMLAWSQDENLWKRRSAILCQLGFKEKTDLPLLYACIEPSIGSREFFLRKGIGWALRQYAWTDPGEVRRYVLLNGKRLSGLSKREALKNVSASGQLLRPRGRPLS